MYFICPRCGCTQGFQQTYLKKQGHEIQVWDGMEDEITDYKDYEETDSEEIDWDDMYCAECDERTKELGNKIEVMEFQAMHTNEDGTWEEIELKKPNKKIQNEILIEKLERGGK